jgi:hypothetical protein
MTEEIEEIKDWYILEVTPEAFIQATESMTEDERSRFSQLPETVRWNIPKTKCLVHLIKGEIPSVLIDSTPISFKGMKEIINTDPEWIGDIEINNL